jgi:hypothetical protein
VEPATAFAVAEEPATAFAAAAAAAKNAPRCRERFVAPPV